MIINRLFDETFLYVEILNKINEVKDYLENLDNSSEDESIHSKLQSVYRIRNNIIGLLIRQDLTYKIVKSDDEKLYIVLEINGKEYSSELITIKNVLHKDYESVLSKNFNQDFSDVSLEEVINYGTKKAKKAKISKTLNEEEVGEVLGIMGELKIEKPVYSVPDKKMSDEFLNLMPVFDDEPVEENKEVEKQIEEELVVEISEDDIENINRFFEEVKETSPELLEPEEEPSQKEEVVEDVLDNSFDIVSVSNDEEIAEEIIEEVPVVEEPKKEKKASSKKIKKNKKEQKQIIIKDVEKEVEELPVRNVASDETVVEIPEEIVENTMSEEPVNDIAEEPTSNKTEENSSLTSEEDEVLAGLGDMFDVSVVEESDTPSLSFDDVLEDTAQTVQVDAEEKAEDTIEEEIPEDIVENVSEEDLTESFDFSSKPDVVEKPVKPVKVKAIEDKPKEIIKVKKASKEDHNSLCPQCKTKVNSSETLCHNCGYDLTTSFISLEEMEDRDEYEQFDENDIKKILEEIKAEYEKNKKEREAAEEEARRKREEEENKNKIDLNSAPTGYVRDSFTEVKLFNPTESDPIKKKAELICDIYKFKIMERPSEKVEEEDTTPKKRLTVQEARELEKNKVEEETRINDITVYLFPLHLPPNGTQRTAEMAVYVVEDGLAGCYCSEYGRGGSLRVSTKYHTLLFQYNWQEGVPSTRFFEGEEKDYIIEATKTEIRPSDISIVGYGHPYLTLSVEYVDGTESISIHALTIPDTEPDADGNLKCLYVLDDPRAKKREMIAPNKNSYKASFGFQDTVNIISCIEEGDNIVFRAITN